VDVGPPARSASVAEAAEPTAAVAGRVLRARERAAARLTGTPWRVNAEVPGTWLRRQLIAVPGLVMTELDRALDRGVLSLRGVDRVLRLAWTLADLGDRDAPTRDDVGLALGLRTRGHGG
jgi:magnesium chelatase family protein